MKNRDKMSKINLIMSVISLDIVIVIICFNLGKIYLTIILGIGIIIGSIFFMKLTKFLLDKFYPQTFFAIIGFTLGSVFILYPRIYI